MFLHKNKSYGIPDTQVKDSIQERNTEHGRFQGNSAFKKQLEIPRQFLQELKQHNNSFNKSLFNNSTFQ